jgi:hypothetical protein
MDHVFLASALVGGEWSASLPGSFNPRGNSSRYPPDMGLGGSRNRFGRRGKYKSLDTPGTRTSSPSAVQPVAKRSADYAIPARLNVCYISK